MKLFGRFARQVFPTGSSDKSARQMIIHEKKRENIKWKIEKTLLHFYFNTADVSGHGNSLNEKKKKKKKKRGAGKFHRKAFSYCVLQIVFVCDPYFCMVR
ncbi:hypothetical protein POVCU1_048010 [Plasmodium ovale curtisi]|uniref:Uncharacterized protein n=1 Tax=Plasmodium ovale curtisi TaxID=864141 RepID=A0A1A8X262_PLAOA|nr:hypothetical protein POVCU1_048010 [Plasmodium ovale curtisi]